MGGKKNKKYSKQPAQSEEEIKKEEEPEVHVVTENVIIETASSVEVQQEMVEDVAKMKIEVTVSELQQSENVVISEAVEEEEVKDELV